LVSLALDQVKLAVGRDSYEVGALLGSATSDSPLKCGEILSFETLQIAHAMLDRPVVESSIEPFASKPHPPVVAQNSFVMGIEFSSRGMNAQIIRGLIDHPEVADLSPLDSESPAGNEGRD
jgi:hypothetical protein